MSSENPRPSSFMSFFNAVTFTRNLVLNIFFIFAVLVASLFFLSLFLSGDKGFNIPNGSTLVIDLENSKVVEEYSKTPIDRALSSALGQSSSGEVPLYDILQAIDAAKDDKRIKQIYLRLEGFSGGLAQIREITQSIDAFKKSGKKVYSFANSYNQKQYYLASSASHVYIDLEGSVLLEGLSDYRQYYRTALQDKLGVNMHLFRVGEFKSAAEPYVRDSASPESKEASLFWMNDLWKRYLSDVGSHRKIDPETIQKNINSSVQQVKENGGNLAKMALEQKLVDGLLTEEMVRREILKTGTPDEGADSDSSVPAFAQTGLGYYLGELRFKKGIPSMKDTVAVVVAQGEIVDGGGDSGSVGGDSLSEKIRNIRESKNVKAMVLRVDSPGGAVFASEQIRREVELFKKSGRPVVVSMGNVAASGGYWISMDADRIFADPSTITGSIGIFGLVPNFSEALGKIGVRTDGVGTTAIAGYADVTKPFPREAESIIQEVINNGYDKFIGKVASARSMPVPAVDKIARGRVWSGEQAIERKLVDASGGLQDAIREASKLAKLKLPSVIFAEQEPQSIISWLLNMQKNALVSSVFGQAPLSLAAVIQERAKESPDAKIMLRALEKKGQVSTYAHCACGIP